MTREGEMWPTSCGVTDGNLSPPEYEDVEGIKRTAAALPLQGTCEENLGTETDPKVEDLPHRSHQRNR